MGLRIFGLKNFNPIIVLFLTKVLQTFELLQTYFNPIIVLFLTVVEKSIMQMLLHISILL